MKAIDIMKDVIGENFAEDFGQLTVDTLKAGDPEKEIKKIGCCLTATPDVLRAAKEWGCDLLITHEPTFYNHLDDIDNSPLTKRKQELVADADVVIYRYHDSMHFRTSDKISESFLAKLGWEGEFDGVMAYTLKEAKTPVQIAREISEKLGLKHPRIVGKRDGMVTKLNLALGARGSQPYTDFRYDDFEVIISGELCEWYDCEPIRDLAQLGEQKTAIILGHVGSERDGMEDLARDINGKYDGAEAKYFECGEIYTYVD